jgi:ribosomal protein S27AE
LSGTIEHRLIGWSRKTGYIYEKKCPACNTVFITNHFNRMICSDECRKIRRQETVKKYVHRRIKNREVTKQCTICGKDFATHLKLKRTCSEECQKYI